MLLHVSELSSSLVSGSTTSHLDSCIFTNFSISGVSIIKEILLQIRKSNHTNRLCTVLPHKIKQKTLNNHENSKLLVCAINALCWKKCVPWVLVRSMDLWGRILVTLQPLWPWRGLGLINLPYLMQIILVHGYFFPQPVLSWFYFVE